MAFCFRILYLGAMASSLLLCLVLVVLWVRSYVVADSLVGMSVTMHGREMRRAHYYGFTGKGGIFGRIVTDVHYFPPPPSNSGCVILGLRDEDLPQESSAMSILHSADISYPGEFFHSCHPGTRTILGFGWFREEGHWAFDIHYWLPTIATGLLPALWFWRASRKRHPLGSCRICGYDLRATPDRCPECGTAPAEVKP